MKRSNFLFNSFIQKIRWPFGYLVFFICACNNPPEVKTLILSHSDSIRENLRIKNAFKKIDLIEDSVKNGDLVTRTGNDFTSESLRSLNQRNKTYSHCGIASIEDDSLFIYHALGGDFNPDQKLLREPFRYFAEPYSNKGIGIYRFDFNEQQIHELLEKTKRYYHAGLPFDMDFDLATNNKMYCAEFVAKTYQSLNNAGLSFNLSRIGRFTFIGVDDIFLHPGCNRITSIVYK